MRNLFTIFVMWLGFSFTANAQIYTFGGSVRYDGGTVLADAFDNATTFTATLVFDGSQLTGDAAGYYTNNGTNRAFYDFISLTYQIGGESWSHSGTFSTDYLKVVDSTSAGKYDSLSIVGTSEQMTTGGTTIYSTSLFTYASSYINVFTGTDADNLLAFNHSGFNADFGKAKTSLGDISLRNFSLTSVVPMTSTVPEPATWLMMIIGFGMVGAVSRKRRRSQALQGNAA